jgi:hypothetical protein
MDYFLPALLSFFISAFVTFLELITSHYPNTYFLLKKSRSLYIYVLTYGIISFCIMLLIRELTNAGMIKLEGIGLSSKWIQAIVVGISAKAFLHIRLFNVNTGSQSFPIGIESFVYLFEPWLLRKIELDEFNAVREFIDTLVTSEMNIESVKRKIEDNIPSVFPKNEKAAFLADLNQKNTVTGCLELYLTFFGRKSFNRVFGMRS